MAPRFVLMAALLPLSFAACVLAQDGAGKAPESPRQALSVLDKTYTTGHPDLYYEFDGMHRFVVGDYRGAMHYFRLAARYADKPSQLSIGLMYLEGQGVPRSPVMAYAWVALAAERNYPQFMATRDAIWGQLDADQRRQATQQEQALYAQYGDPVAKLRLEQAMRDSLADMSAGGLRPHQDVAVYTSTGGGQCAGGDARDCDKLYADWFWNPRHYFATRDAAWSGTVTVGSLQKAVPAKAGNRGQEPAAGQP
ncbi:sel1 repeat family protein [Rhodanobacter sp. DHB23]|uniref:sel1 repeat family protein n=1 Tax=Rhodanobacter sp. DHB23 TaxID=2775923 RepID=UPI0017824BA1|nr:sel1 repeat family protein [Rhodanobacter sp. DHB23]MBD8873944.1 sel1 repeat family protein [Rhodanobacter sp. DHB23]